MHATKADQGDRGSGDGRLGRRAAMTGGALAAGGALLARPGVAAAHTPADSVFNVKDYNATGDGSTNDTTAVQAAIDAALGTGQVGGVVWFPAGTYRINRTLKLNGATSNIFDKPITLQGAGHASTIAVSNAPAGSPADTMFATASNRAIEANGQEGTRVALGAAAPAGSRQLVVPAAVAGTLAVGSILAIEENITSGWVYGTNGKPFELHKVVSMSGTTVDLDSPLVHGYTGAAVVFKVTPVPGVTVRDLAITTTHPPVTGPGVYAIWVRYGRDLTVERVRIHNAAGGMQIVNVVDAHVRDCTVDGLPKYDGDAFGYGVSVNGACANVSVTGLVGRATRHLLTTLSDQRDASNFYGGPRNVTVVGGIGEGGDARSDGLGPLAIWDTHPYGTDIAFVGCSAIGVGSSTHPGFQVRAKRVRIVDCVAKRNGQRGIHVHNDADEVTISGGEVAYNGEAGITTGLNTTVTGVEVHHNLRGINVNGGTRIHVTNCYVHDNVNEGIRDQGAAGAKSQNVVITGNIVPKGSGSFPQPNSMVGIGGPNAVVANNVLRGYSTGTGNDGTTGFEAGVVRQNNVVSP